MKALVLSDSHGCSHNLFSAIEKESDCKTVFFLGDGLSDVEKCFERYSDREFICVKGNNDFNYSNEYTAYKYIEGNTIVACHGHMFYVKRTLSQLLSHAQSVMANVVFYGHTHKADFHFEPYYGMYVLNPGAACNGCYSVIQLSKNNVEATLFHL